jgi:hypothetical protein
VEAGAVLSEPQRCAIFTNGRRRLEVGHPPVLTCSRAFLENEIRRHTFDLPNVQLISALAALRRGPQFGIIVLKIQIIEVSSMCRHVSISTAIVRELETRNLDRTHARPIATKTTFVGFESAARRSTADSSREHCPLAARCCAAASTILNYY